MGPILVEFLGTLALCLVILSTGNALLIGITLALAIMLGGAISGGAFNPAVTVALYMNKSLSETQLVPYIMAQVLGGMAAFHLVKEGIRLPL